MGRPTRDEVFEQAAPVLRRFMDQVEARLAQEAKSEDESEAA